MDRDELSSLMTSITADLVLMTGVRDNFASDVEGVLSEIGALTMPNPSRTQPLSIEPTAFDAMLRALELVGVLVVQRAHTANCTEDEASDAIEAARNILHRWFDLRGGLDAAYLDDWEQAVRTIKFLRGGLIQRAAIVGQVRHLQKQLASLEQANAAKRTA